LFQRSLKFEAFRGVCLVPSAVCLFYRPDSGPVEL